MASLGTHALLAETGAEGDVAEPNPEPEPIQKPPRPSADRASLAAGLYGNRR